jgi:myo-inositol 2-dehydrogenase/D-chiro-inositol 1-dehydrogenase
VQRFQNAYRNQMIAWVRAAATCKPEGASAWDGYVATAIAEQTLTALQTDKKARLMLVQRPSLYA